MTGLLRRRSLRTRLALLSAAAVASAIAVVAVVAWLATAQALRAQVDDALSRRPPARGAPLEPESICALAPAAGEAARPVAGSVQLVRADGTTCGPAGADLVALQDGDVAAARDGTQPALRDDETAAGTHVRVRTQPVSAGYAVLVARDLTAIDATLQRLGAVLLLASGLGVLGALSAGLIVARSGLRPVDELTRAAEHVAATNELDVPITVQGADEVARLATAFNEMTAALRVARARQQQLVADAGHELRTPLTSLRTNLELLIRSERAGRPLPPGELEDMLTSMTGQVEELSQLTSELTMLARDDAHEADRHAPVRVDDVVRRAVERASRRGHHRIVVDLWPWTTTGDAASLERAVLNLLDNAVKFAPAGSTIDVRLRDGVLEVCDQGPGILAAERPFVFDRFWRSPSARGLPGSGLGLAIVADVAGRHGAALELSCPEGGGTRVRLRLPPAAPPGSPAA